MNWLFEEPWTIITLGVMAQVLLGIALYATGRGMLLYVMLGGAALTGGLLVVERLVVTDREQVTAALYSAAATVEKGDVDDIIACLSPTRADLRQRVKSELQTYRVSSVSIKSDLKITINRLTSPPTARAEFHVVVGGGTRHSSADEFTPPLWFGVTFTLENGRWLISDYEHRWQLL